MMAAQSRMGEDVQMMQEVLDLGKLQDAAGRLMALHDQTTLDSDVKRLKERLSLCLALEEEGSWGQSAPAETPRQTWTPRAGQAQHWGQRDQRQSLSPRPARELQEHSLAP